MVKNTCLITGGAGNLACQLTFALADQVERIVLFDIAERPVAAVAEECTYVRGDLTRREDLTNVLQTHRPQTILHLASLLSGSCEANREMAWKVNMDGSFLLFEAAVAAGVGRLLFPSTLATYGGKLPDPLPEDTPQWPQGLYGMTKVAVERLGVYYHHRFGLDFRGLRLPVIVSPYAPAGAASAYASHAFVQAFQKGAYTFQIRPQTAVSTMYVQDAIRAMVALLRAPAGQLGRRVYNIHALSPTAQEIADAVVGRLPQARLTFHPQPDVVNLIESWPKIIVDTSARQDWAWQPQYDLSRLADDMVLQLRRTQTGEKFS